MWSILETIEKGKVLVTASPGIWVNGHYLHWPPEGQQVDRSILTAPGPDWVVHMCKVLKENIEMTAGEQITSLEDCQEYTPPSHFENTSNAEGHYFIAAHNIAESTNKENEFSAPTDFDDDNIPSDSDVTRRSKINVLENILIEPQTKLSSQSSASFEHNVMKHLNALAEAQKLSEKRQVMFEAKIEKKLDSFVNDKSRTQGPSRSIQNRNLIHQEPVRWNQHTGIKGRSRSNDSQNRQNQCQNQEIAYPPIPDFEKFEEFDENFPINKFENVAELEYHIRIDLELKFTLKSRLNEITGIDPKAALRNKMKYLFTDRVLERYTWNGTAEKQPFKSLRYLNNLLYVSVREQFGNYKSFEYKNYMVQWLKHAKSRQREVTYRYPKQVELNDEGSDDEENFDDY